MFIAKLLLLSLLLFSGVSAIPIPNSIRGKWKIGKPYADMTPQPIALSARQEKKLIGQILIIEPTGITACGVHIQIRSVKEVEYLPDAFLQRYGIRPDQIGLHSAVVENAFKYSSSDLFCGSAEGLVVLTDGENAALETANEYFHLSRVKSE